MTERLYYSDSHMKEFDAVVLECVLDRTAFFPEGGGQLADDGVLVADDCGEEVTVHVKDAHEKGGIVYHYADAPLETGTKVKGIINWEQRFSNMQQHSGEHIVSGLIHSTFGYDNVGFHLGKEIVTMDFNGPLTKEDLKMIEERANEVVWSNREIRTEFPDAETLKSLEYRSKIEIEGDVRIVTVPGVDVCACCAPHVSRTGEIGMIKIVDAQSHRGGMRITILCGDRALRDYNRKQENVYAVSVALSAKQEKVSEAVLKQKEEVLAIKESYARAMEELITYRAAGVEDTDGSICVFESFDDAKALRELTNLLVPKAGKAAAVFSGNDKDGYRYIIGSREMDMRGFSKSFNQVLNGRGGGSKEMIQGTVFATAEKIKEYMDGI